MVQARGEQGVVDGGAAFVAGAWSFEGVQPGDGAFDDPPVVAQSGAVGYAAAGDDGLDAAGPETAAVDVMVVAAIGVDHAGPSQRTADPAADRRDRVQ